MGWIFISLISLLLVPPGMLLLQSLFIMMTEALRSLFTTLYEFFGLLGILFLAYWS
jgi:hypothetical protein